MRGRKTEGESVRGRNTEGESVRTEGERKCESEGGIEEMKVIKREFKGGRMTNRREKDTEN